MKDGRTHLAYKTEHAVDVASGTVIGVTVQPTDKGDTDSVAETLKKAREASQRLNERGVEEVVADCGYHSGRVMRELRGRGIRSYVAEPRRKRQHWAERRREQPAVCGHRRRVRGERGKRLQPKRGELVERSSAHIYDTGGLRRLHLRGRQDVLKRVLIQGSALNLGLLMRTCFGAGKPKRAADRNQMLGGGPVDAPLRHQKHQSAPRTHWRWTEAITLGRHPGTRSVHGGLKNSPFTTRC